MAGILFSVEPLDSVAIRSIRPTSAILSPVVTTSWRSIYKYKKNKKTDTSELKTLSAIFIFRTWYFTYIDSIVKRERKMEEKFNKRKSGSYKMDQYDKTQNVHM